jgi:hypothetical protein
MPLKQFISIMHEKALWESRYLYNRDKDLFEKESVYKKIKIYWWIKIRI